MEGERDAWRIKLQISEEQVSLPGKEQTAVPTIPEEHVDVVARGGQPECACVKDMSERGPGHEDDRQRSDDQDAPVVAQQRTESLHDRRHLKRNASNSVGGGQ